MTAQLSHSRHLNTTGIPKDLYHDDKNPSHSYESQAGAFDSPNETTDTVCTSVLINIRPPF